jgi:hypothetical protein
VSAQTWPCVLTRERAIFALNDTRAQLLSLVRRSQDGDRACVDYRNATATAWQQAAAADIDPPDARLAEWAAQGASLHERHGGFERSLPEIDAMADAVHRRFGGQAALRVAAAGLGGACVCFCVPVLVDDVSAWLAGRGWVNERVEAGAGTHVFL